MEEKEGITGAEGVLGVGGAGFNECLAVVDSSIVVWS